MIWEQKLPTIVMLTKCFEERVSIVALFEHPEVNMKHSLQTMCGFLFVQKKCECYWPESKDEIFHAGDEFEVKLTSSVPFSDFVIRKMTIETVKLIKKYRDMLWFQHTPINCRDLNQTHLHWKSPSFTLLLGQIMVSPVTHQPCLISSHVSVSFIPTLTPVPYWSTAVLEWVGLGHSLSWTACQRE